MGIILGFLVGSIRSSYDKNNGKLFKHKFFNGVFAVINWLCKLYLTVIRGTPVVVQLMIIYFGGEVFRCEPLRVRELLRAALLSCTVLPADLLRKLLVRRRKGKRAP